MTGLHEQKNFQRCSPAQKSVDICCFSFCYHNSNTILCVQGQFRPIRTPTSEIGTNATTRASNVYECDLTESITGSLVGGLLSDCQGAAHSHCCNYSSGSVLLDTDLPWSSHRVILRHEASRWYGKQDGRDKPAWGGIRVERRVGELSVHGLDRYIPQKVRYEQHAASAQPNSNQCVPPPIRYSVHRPHARLGQGGHVEVASHLHCESGFLNRARKLMCAEWSVCGIAERITILHHSRGRPSQQHCCGTFEDMFDRDPRVDQWEAGSYRSRSIWNIHGFDRHCDVSRLIDHPCGRQLTKKNTQVLDGDVSAQEMPDAAAEGRKSRERAEWQFSVIEGLGF
jgi:hypothetical protein